MRPRFHVLVAAFSAGVILATGLFTLWVLGLIWQYGMIWVGEPNRLLLGLEIVMAAWASGFSALVLVVFLREGVKECQV
jgi:ABC-type multidrug transport system permease subunit